MDEDVLGPAVALDHLRPTEACVVVRDITGALFVRAMRDEDFLDALGPV
jgi:hypothetical protein